MAKMHQVKKIDGYDSKLEKYCAEQLQLAGIEYKYPGPTYVFVEPFKYEGLLYERKKGSKEMVLKSSHVRKLTYTPDFIGKSWIIETKGHRTNEFNIKWKLFKKHLNDLE